MPLLDLNELTAQSNRRQQKEQLIKELQARITSDISGELNTFRTILGKLDDALRDSTVLRADTKLNMLVEATLDEFAKVYDMFDKNSIYYSDPQVMAFRKLVVTSLQQKKYSSLVDKINSYK